VIFIMNFGKTTPKQGIVLPSNKNL